MGATYFAAEIAATMSAISGLSDAPPTRKPSMSGKAESSGAFLAFAEPPYWMRISSAVVWSTFFAIQSRMPLSAMIGETVSELRDGV